MTAFFQGYLTCFRVVCLGFLLFTAAEQQATQLHGWSICPRKGLLMEGRREKLRTVLNSFFFFFFWVSFEEMNNLFLSIFSGVCV